jgi:iron complex outermembrane receptor protein
VQAVGTVGAIDYVAGLFYFNEHVSDDAATPNSVAIAGYTTAGQTSGYTFTVLDPCTGSAGFGSQPGCRSIDRASEVWSKSYAAYGQMTWNVSSQLHLTAGARLTNDKKYGVLHYSRNINYDVDTVRAAANGYKPMDRSWTRFNPTVTLAYDAADDLHVYAKYTTGYRAGGASSRTSDYGAFDPEGVKSYEVGFKSDLLDHRVRLNVAGYMMDRTNSQVDLSTIQPTATGNFNNLVTFNAAGVTKIRGVEADLTVKPVEGLTLNASYAYTYTDIPTVPVTYQAYNGSGVAVGAPSVVQQKFYVVFTPRNAASGSADYVLPVSASGAELKLHLDANYSQSTQTFDQFATKNDASFIVNGRISLAEIPMGSTGRTLTVSAWARNLFDYQYVYRRDPSNSLPAVQTTAVTGVDVVHIGNVGNVLGDYGNFNAPRTFGAEATVRF